MRGGVLDGYREWLMRSVLMLQLLCYLTNVVLSFPFSFWLRVHYSSDVKLLGLRNSEVIRFDYCYMVFSDA